MSSENTFWLWFVQHQNKLLDVKGDQEYLFNQLSTELAKYDPDLTFKIGLKGTRGEFIISAGGLKRAFPAVVSLMAAAPVVEKWQIIAFRPRRTSTIAIELGGKSVNPEDVQFSLLDDGTTAGIYLFIPGFQEDNVALVKIGYLLLDDMLGEYEVETQLGLIRMFSPDTQTNGTRYSLAQLPALFDQLIAHLEKRSGKPS